MGTQAELDALKSKLSNLCSEYNTVSSELSDLDVACESMDSLQTSFENYKSKISTTIESYNEGSNEWKGNFYNTICESEGAIDFIIENFEGTLGELKDLRDSKRYRKEDLQESICRTQDDITYFHLDEE